MRVERCQLEISFECRLRAQRVPSSHLKNPDFKPRRSGILSLGRIPNDTSKLKGELNPQISYSAPLMTFSIEPTAETLFGVSRWAGYHIYIYTGGNPSIRGDTRFLALASLPRLATKMRCKITTSAKLLYKNYHWDRRSPMRCAREACRLWRKRELWT